MIPPLSRFHNSREAGGDGSNPNCILADSFERDWWYRQNGDDVPVNPGTSDPVDGIGEAGWIGTIYGPENGSGNPIRPLNAIDANYKGVGGKQYCACYGDPGDPANGLTNRVGSVHQAMHPFSSGPVSELRARWFAKWEPDALFSGEKHMNFTQLAGDIRWCNVQLNCGASGASTSATPHVQIIHGTEICQAPNVTPGFVIEPNDEFYCFDFWLKLNSAIGVADGAIDMHITRCGVTGLAPVNDVGAPVTSPILRTSMRDVLFNRAFGEIEVLWAERWANGGSGVGSDGMAYFDCLYVVEGDNGGNPIGFVDPALFS